MTEPTSGDLPDLTLQQLLDLYADCHYDARVLRQNGHSGAAAVVASQSLHAVFAEVERRVA